MSLSKATPMKAHAILLAGLLWMVISAAAQSEAYTFTTIAGISATGSADGVGTSAQFNFPQGVAVDSSGILYVADSENFELRKIVPVGVVTTLAGLAGSQGNV